MSQKRDREEDTMESRKVQKVNNEELRLRKYLEDLDYWKKNTPPSWELLRERYENLVQWDMYRKKKEQKQEGTKGNVYMYSMYNDLEHFRKQDHNRRQSLGGIKYDKDYNKLGIKRRQWVRMTNAIDEVRKTTRLIKEGKEKVLIQREGI